MGVWQNDRVEIIANDQGNRTTPSYVAFTDTERLIGDAAKNQTAMNPLNTVFDAKRLIGRKINDPTVQADMKHWPFGVVAGPDQKPMVEGGSLVLSRHHPIPRTGRPHFDGKAATAVIVSIIISSDNEAFQQDYYVLHSLSALLRMHDVNVICVHQAFIAGGSEECMNR